MSRFGYAFVHALYFTIISVCILMPAWRIISAWLHEKILGARSALPALCLLFGLSGLCWYFGGEKLALGFVLLLTIVNLLFPWFNNWLEHAAVRRMHYDDMDKYRQAIERDPTNTGAHEFLADRLMERRQYTEAIAEYEIVVALTKKANTHERWKLQRAIAAKERQARESLVACEKCDALSPIGTRTCPLCGLPSRKIYGAASRT